MLTFFQNSKFTNLELVFALECRFYAVIDRIISLPFGVGGMRSRLVEKAQQKRTRRQGGEIAFPANLCVSRLEDAVNSQFLHV